jgi:hypothetical protein
MSESAATGEKCLVRSLQPLFRPIDSQASSDLFPGPG